MGQNGPIKLVPAASMYKLKSKVHTNDMHVEKNGIVLELKLLLLNKKKKSFIQNIQTYLTKKSNL